MMTFDPAATPPELALKDDVNEHQGSMTQQQHQQQQQQQDQPQQQSSSAASVISSIASLFSAEADELDAIELKEYDDRTGKTPQAHHGHDSNSNDGHLQRGRATPNSNTYEDSDTNTGSTASEHKSSSEAAPVSPPAPVPSLGKVPSRFSAFWRNHISVVVHFKDARDHLALERTYLAYHRTGMVLAMLATATAQLTVINHAPSPSPSFGFYVIGKPLAAALAACALINSIVGGLRWWRLQQGLLRGVAISGGREVLLIAGIIGAITAVFFGLIIAVDIEKEYK